MSQQLRGSETSHRRRMDRPREGTGARTGDESGHRRMHRRAAPRIQGRSGSRAGCRRTGLSGVARHVAAGSRKDFEARGGSDARARRAYRAHRHHRRRQDHSRNAPGDARLGRHPGMVRRRRPQGLWPRAAATSAGRADDRPARAGGTGGRVRALEFSRRQSVPQAGRGAGGGVSLHHEAGRAYAGVGARSGARSDGRRAAERRDVDGFRRAVAGLYASCWRRQLSARFRSPDPREWASNS